MCSSTDSPDSANGTDDKEDPSDGLTGGFQVPVDEWRRQYTMAFNVMRRFFYNSADHHNVKALPKGKCPHARKGALYKQWPTKKLTEQVKLAELACKSPHLTEAEKKVVKARYLMQKKNLAAKIGKATRIMSSFMPPSVCSRTMLTNGCLSVHLG